MKTKLAAIVSVLALVTTIATAQTPAPPATPAPHATPAPAPVNPVPAAAPAPIVIAPVTTTVVSKPPLNIPLSSAQVSGLVTALAGQGITFDPNSKVQRLMIVLHPDGSATATVMFFQQ